MPSDYFNQQKGLVDELEQSFSTNNHRSTVVGIQQDYANSKEICLTSVTFLPDKLASQISEQVSVTLGEADPGHYFFDDKSFHLTIKNIRTVNSPPLFNDDDVAKVQLAFQKLIPQFNDLEFSVEDVVLFPTSISVMAYCSSNELQKLVLALDKELKAIGVPDNKLYHSDTIFWGNITICRFTSPPSQKLINAAKQMRNLKIGTFKAHRIDLITCNAVCYPQSRKTLGQYELLTPLSSS